MSLPAATATDKIHGRHRDRLAVVYVRQSTLQQVGRHPESTRLQYALAERAQRLGWARERVVVIDDDLGRSGTSAEVRPGFQRLVAEVGLGRVGLVLGAEVSRLARSCRDWHQLLEIGALFDTLIADGDGVLDPAAYNDRLLLGLKGTMSEAELHILKGRMQAGRDAKARRGELSFNLPRGYVRRPSGEVALDPDEQAQAVVRLVFDLFDQRRTINGVLVYLAAHDVRLPNRLRGGPAKGELVWRRPNRHTLGEMLTNPAYAGAYAYGRRAIDPRRRRPGYPGSGRIKREPGAMVLLRDRWPAYISWQDHERNCAQVTANRARHTGVPRGGPSLLAGLLVCGRCGRRMATFYPQGGHYLRYGCGREAVDYGAAACQSLSGRCLDALVGGLIVQALAPAAVEASLQLAEDVELERTALQRQWRQRLERARYEAERARRQFDTVEPENRLVARTLERQWEQALAEELRLRAEHERFEATQPLPLTAAELAAIRRLTEDIPALWRAPTTTARDRQAIARLLLERVEVTVEGASERVAVTCHWAGGVRTGHALTRPVQRLTQLSGYRALMERIGGWHATGLPAPAIAETLNREGWRPPKRRATFTAAMVRRLLGRQGVRPKARHAPSRAVARRGATELTLLELAGHLEMPYQSVYRWLRRGLLHARRATTDQGRPIWLITADAEELERLRALRPASRPGRPSCLPPPTQPDSWDA
jgi:DNA invertase Pin-like site-specific DNA recombinase